MKKRLLNITFILLISFVFIDIVGAETYNNYESATVSCGDGMISNIPTIIPKIVSIAYTIIQIAVPVILVVMGSLDLMKSVTASKEEDIKKGQQMFIKRLIAAALVFFVFVVVKLIISFVADSTKTGILECANCFIKNSCDS